MPMEEPDVDVYSSIFNQHLQKTQEHLQGATPATAQIETCIIGSASWTSAEIDSFFHALAVHSRLRPDLISTSIRTKNMLEVVEYLDLLEANSKRVGRQSSDGFQTPIAYEMSKDWVSWEETQAQSLRARESSSISGTKDSGTSRTQLLPTNTKDAFLSIGSSSPPPIGEGGDSRELSPIPRRRLQKRMCMRRKRARERGEEVNTSTSLLKRGRRSNDHKLLWSKKSNIEALKPIITQEHENPSDCPISQRSPSKADTGFLENDAKLIHVPNLRNFLRFYVGLHDKRLLDGSEDINPDVVELLTDMTQDFVSDIICRVIILQEEQKAMKRSIKVWRQCHHDDDTIIIKRSTINQCLDSMFLGARTRTQYFQDLLTSFDLQADNDQDVSWRQADFTTPPRCEFLPGPFNSSTGLAHRFSSVDEIYGNLTLDEDNRLDQKDSVADWAYEVDLWTRINRGVEQNLNMSSDQ